MRLFLISCVMLLSACAPDPQVVLRAPEIPADLLTPEPVPARPAETLADVGLLLVDYDEALGRANGKISAIGEIVGPQ
jgi:hypothetical protein